MGGGAGGHKGTKSATPTGRSMNDYSLMCVLFTEDVD